KSAFSFALPRRARRARRARTSLLVEPDIFHAPAVVHAVDHRRQTFDPGMSAGRPARMEDDRPRAFPLQCRIDVPDQRLAAVLVGLARLPVKQILELTIAVSGEVAVGVAGVALV